MHYIPPTETYQFFSIELRNLHPESSNEDIVFILNQLCSIIGFKRNAKNLEKAEIVVASLGEAVALFEHPINIQGQRVKLFPYIYLGLGSSIRYEVKGNAVYFEFDPETILEKALFDLIFEEFGSQASIDYQGSNETERRQNISKRMNGVQTKVISVLPQDGFSVVNFQKKFGYSGHNFDLPLTWVDYNQEHYKVWEQLQKVFGKEAKKIEIDLEKYNQFKNTKKWGAFYDPNARGHSKWLYRSVTNKKEFKKSKNLDYFSDSKNEKFFEIAHKYAENPLSIQRRPSVKGDKEYVFKFVAPESVDYKKGIISIYDAIKIKAENRKKAASTLKNSKNNSVGCETKNNTAPQEKTSTQVVRSENRKRSDPKHDRGKERSTKRKLVFSPEKL